MLVLNRKPNQQIVIAGSIIVTVVGIENGKVKLGIEAPRDVSVHRAEVQDRIDRQQRGGAA